jgi:hypothetical protein
VTYPLRHRYLNLSATIRPYFTAVPDAEARVYAIVGIRERDGTLTRQTRGMQVGVRMDSPAGLSAEVDGAEEMTLRVECEYPEGSVVLAEPSLAPA